MKTCKECGEEKELDQFHRNPRMADGRLNECKACANAKRQAYRRGPGREVYLARYGAEYQRARYAANREKRVAQQRARRAANPEKDRDRQRELRAKDPARVNGWKRAWVAANPDKVKDSRRAYNQRHYAAVKQRNALYGLLKKHGMTLEDWAALWDFQGGRCYLCGCPMSKELKAKDGAVIDHDHACCGPLKSCRFCRRGLACRLCNLVVGCAHDDPARLRLIADNLEVVIRSLSGRPKRPLALPLWELNATSETETA